MAKLGFKVDIKEIHFDWEKKEMVGFVKLERAI